MNGTLRSLTRSGTVHGAVAFLAMGSWAAFANAAHPMPEPLRAALLQGALSACTTLVLKTVVERIAARLEGLPALFLPAIAASLLSAAILGVSHSISGTPELLATIVLPLSVSTGYAAFYSHALWTDRKAPGNVRIR